MKKIFRFITVLALVLSITACDKTQKLDTTTWTDDFMGAKKAAAKEGKEIILLIGTGDENPSDNPTLDYPSFKNDVLFSDEFISKLTEKYILVNYDFNESLYEKILTTTDATAERKLLDAMVYFTLYGLEKLPAVSVLTEEGFVETQFYFDEKFPENADDFLAMIEEHNEEIAAVKEMVSATKIGTEDERITAMDTFYDMMPDSLKITTVEISRKLVALDRTNKSGLVSKHLFAIADADFMLSLLYNDYDAALKSLSTVCENKFLTPDEKQQLYFSYPFMLAQGGYPDYEVLKSYFQKAYDVAPNSEHAAQIKGMIEYVTILQEAEAEQLESILNNPSPAPEIVDLSSVDTVANPESVQIESVELNP